MTGFFQEIFVLLTSSPGNLAYHLVIAFSIVGALLSAITSWQKNEFPQAKRMVIGLSSLIFIRLLLFMFAALAWQGLVDEQIFLPVVDRAANLISAIIIVWMWVFPEAQRLADAATALLIFLAITLLVFNLVWWSNLDTGMYFNATWPDGINQFSSMGVLLLGCVGLLLRRPNSWGIGLGMLTLLFLGNLIYSMAPYPPGDYPGAVRLAEMAAYPLLLALPHRFSEKSPSVELVVEERQRYGLPPEVLDAFVSLSTFQSPEQVCRAIVTAVSHTFLADLSLLVSPPDTQDYMAILCGYDLIREKSIEGVGIDSHEIPLIAAALKKGSPLRLPASSTSPDLQGLGNALNLGKCGHLLVTPIKKEGEEVVAGIILLSPYSNRSWSTEDQNNLIHSSKPMAQLLHQTHETHLFEAEIDQARQELGRAQDQYEHIHQENEALRAELSETKKLIGSNRSQVESLEALLIAHEEAQAIIAQLQSEIASLRQSGVAGSAAILAVSSSVGAKNEQDEVLAKSGELEEELRITLKEVARLQTVLSDADRKILELERGLLSVPSSFENMEIITNLAQELRQPMSSIIGYTDFLLGETVGILGNLQRKFLERVRLSAEKMSKLVDELIIITNAELTPMLSDYSPVDLNRVVDESVAEISDQLRSKDITLRVDLQERLPLLYYDSQVLQDTLSTLLENAGAVTPEEGEIALRVKVERDEVIGNYILVQVADLGGGIDKENLSRVLSPPEDQDVEPINGVGEALNKLPELRASIEAMDGRIWIDSEPGMGSVFSLLLPINTEPETNSAGGEKPA